MGQAGLFTVDSYPMRVPGVRRPRTASFPKPVPSFDWDEIDALRPAYRKLPAIEGFTVSEYMDRFKLAETVARREINRMVQEGKLKVAGKKWFMSSNGSRSATCYAKVDDPKTPVVRGHRG